jgi:DNA-binding response OmpR family regulator
LEKHEIANLTVRSDEFDILIDGRRIGLTRREFELFMVLVERPDRVVQRSEIYELIWGGTMRKRDRAVDVLVRKVRTKLMHAAPEWRYIHTHFGVGYRFAPERPAGRGGPAPTIRHSVPRSHGRPLETVRAGTVSASLFQ